MLFQKIINWLSGTKNSDKPHPLDGPIRAAEEKMHAPYKLEQPTSPPVVETKPIEAVNAIAEPARCGCGRSPTGLCVGLHKLTTEEWSGHADNPNRAVVAAPEVKAEAKPKPAKKPAAKKPKAEAKLADNKKEASKKTASKKKVDTVVQAPARKTTTRKSK